MDHFIAIVDLGSNSARLVVYKQDPHGLMFEFDNIKQVLRLSSHLTAERLIDEEGIAKTLECMAHFKQVCAARNVQEIIGVATAAVRQAQNGAELIERIFEDTGIRFRILSGQEEAKYGYLAVVNSMDVRDAYTVDIGGGSTEITYFKDRMCKKAVSFPFGAVTLTKEFLKQDVPTPEELQRLEAFLQEQFQREAFLREHPGVPLVALGGAARNVANMHQKKSNYPFNSLHQYVIEASEVSQLYAALASTPLTKRKKMKGLSKDRADIIVAAAAVFHTLLRVIGGNEFIASTKGLRDGLLFERILQDQGTGQIEDVALFSARELLKRYHVNQVRGEKVSEIAVNLYDQFREAKLLAGDAHDRKLVQIAGLLHEVGLAINVYEKSQHTFYLLTNVLLMGLSHRDRLVVAMIASYKSDKRLQKQSVLYQDILPVEDFDRIKRLSLLLVVARSLDRFLSSQVQSIELQMEKDKILLTCPGIKQDLVEYTLLNEIQEQLSKAYQRPFVLDL